MQCACRFTENCQTCEDETSTSKRQETKLLIERLRKTNPNIEISIFNSIHSVCLDTMVGYKSGNVSHSFLETYDDNSKKTESEN